MAAIIKARRSSASLAGQRVRPSDDAGAPAGVVPGFISTDDELDADSDEDAYAI